jgi:hypothetical protein
MLLAPNSRARGLSQVAAQAHRPQALQGKAVARLSIKISIFSSIHSAS